MEELAEGQVEDQHDHQELVGQGDRPVPPALEEIVHDRQHHAGDRDGHQQVQRQQVEQHALHGACSARSCQRRQ